MLNERTPTDIDEQIRAGTFDPGNTKTVSSLGVDNSAQSPDGVRVEPSEEWPARQPLARTIEEVPPLQSFLIPEPLRGWLVDVATRASIPLEFVAVPAIVVLSSLVGRSLGIRSERFDDWLAVPNLWGAIVARPGMLKTAAIGSGLAPLRPLIAKAAAENAELAKDARARKIVLESKLRSLGKNKVPDEEEVREQLDLIDSCRPVERRYMTQDATVEKLGEILRDNPRGILLCRDELIGWLRSFSKPGREGDRAFYLEAWNGDGSFTVDRIGRGTIHVPALCLSVVGAIQPSKLRRYVQEAIFDGDGADGLLQRFQLLVWPDRREPYRPITRHPDSDARERAFAIYKAIDKLDPHSLGAEASTEGGVPFIRFACDAQERFDAWRAEYEPSVRGDDLAGFPAFEAHLAKYRSLVPSLALIFHLVDVFSSSGSSGSGVSFTSVQSAITWCEYLEAHARKLYAPELTPDFVAAKLLAKKIEDGLVDHLARVRDLYRPQWSGLRSPELVIGALQVLERLGWLRVVKTPTGGRSAEEVHLHPELRGRARR